MSRLTPARRRGVELLDLPDTPVQDRAAAMHDLERSNVLFGGTAAVLSALRRIAARLPERVTLVDVATGTGDIPARAKRLIAAETTAIGVDLSPDLLRTARDRLDGCVAADARRLPLRSDSADLVTCSQALHHFFDNDPRHIVRELHRVARGHVIISDLRRSWLAAAGFWLASLALRFHRITRQDGVTSVMRGFTAEELRALVRDVTGVTPVIQTGLFWRVSAIWTKPVGRISAS